MVIVTFASPPDAELTVPGSKSLSQRALLVAALAEGVSQLHDPLDSEDTRLLCAALRAFGVAIDCGDARCWQVTGSGGRLRPPAEPLYLANNGTATRLLTSVAALAAGEVRITGDARMAQRPIAPLLSALQGWGVAVASERENGCPPLRIAGRGIRGGGTTLAAGQSSQYLSSLLLVAPYAAQEASITVTGTLYSRPYVEMTLAVMRDFGVPVQADAELRHFVVSPGKYRGRSYAVEGDASGASYFFAAAAIGKGRVRVENLSLPSLQGDARFLELLERMGCRIHHRGGLGVCVQGPPELKAIEADMGDMPDVAPTLAVVAAFAHGQSTIGNIAHLRVKESDRVSAVVQELRRLGVAVDEYDDAIRIHGRGGEGLHGARIHTYNDHRIAMSFALAGLRVSGVEIADAHCVAKSFPDFWERFRLLYPQGTPSTR